MQDMELIQFDIVYGVFNPKNRATLKPECLPYIDKVIFFQAIWIIEEGKYEGQWALLPLNSPMTKWVPECDVDHLTMHNNLKTNSSWDTKSAIDIQHRRKCHATEWPKEWRCIIYLGTKWTTRADRAKGSKDPTRKDRVIVYGDSLQEVVNKAQGECAARFTYNVEIAGKLHPVGLNGIGA
jgi:hypothetical protein